MLRRRPPHDAPAPPAGPRPPRAAGSCASCTCIVARLPQVRHHLHTIDACGAALPPAARRCTVAPRLLHEPLRIVAAAAPLLLGSCRPIALLPDVAPAPPHVYRALPHRPLRSLRHRVPLTAALRTTAHCPTCLHHHLNVAGAECDRRRKMIQHFDFAVSTFNLCGSNVLSLQSQHLKMKY